MALSWILGATGALTLKGHAIENWEEYDSNIYRPHRLEIEIKNRETNLCI